MSIYIGKDGNSNSVLHMTSGDYTKQDMVSGVLPTTSFHSTLPYVIVDTYRVNASSYWTGSAYGHVNGSRFICPQDVIDKINAGYFVFMITNNSVISGKNWNGLYTNVYWMNSTTTIPYASPFDWSLHTNPTSTYNVACIVGMHSTVTFVITNLHKSLGYIPKSLPNNNISIGSGRIVIRGVDLLNLKYVSSAKVNNSDLNKLTQINSSLIQIVNNNAAEGDDMRITNTPKEQILRGTDVVFDSSIGGKNIYSESSFYTVPSKSLWDGTFTGTKWYTLGSGYTEGELLFITGKVGSTEYTATSTAVFKAGTDIDVLDYYDSAVDGYGSDIVFTIYFYADVGGVLKIKIVGAITFPSYNNLYELTVHRCSN